MSNIAIIDDNPEQSGTLKKLLSRYLRKLGFEWGVLTQSPFQVIEDYFRFIEINDVSIIILDERLNDQGEGAHEPVDYRGDQLVEILRARLKDFPVFMITTFDNDPDVKAKFSEFEYIIPRHDFVVNGEKYIPIIVRSGNRYLDQNQNELNELSDLTTKVINGNTNVELLARIEALQFKLQLPYVGFDERSIWLEKYEERIKELEILQKELTALIKK